MEAPLGSAAAPSPGGAAGRRAARGDGGRAGAAGLPQGTAGPHAAPAQGRGKGEEPLPNFLTSAESSIAPLRPPAFNRRADPPPARPEAAPKHLGKCSPPASAPGPPLGATCKARRELSTPHGPPAGAQRTTAPMRRRARCSPPAAAGGGPAGRVAAAAPKAPGVPSGLRDLRPGADQGQDESLKLRQEMFCSSQYGRETVRKMARDFQQAE